MFDTLPQACAAGVRAHLLRKADMSDPAKLLFITGTDTGVGKTFFTAELARRLVATGRDVGVCKPFASGCDLVDGRLVSPDAELLKSAAGVKDNLHAITPVTYKAPLAPNWAARIEDKPVDLAAASAAIERLREKHDILLLEGIGGIMVPLTDEVTCLDYFADFKPPTLVVARTGLGTLNHTLLTLRALKSMNYDIVGVVLNAAEPSASTLAEQTNTDNLRALIDVPLFGSVPHKPIGKQLSDVLDEILGAAF